ncbi:MAG: glycosyltransferase [Dehalococcoidales bacterium]|jgi:D-inositol-3-phosphate glycosyltransferase|nr:glycosyltransferase [Dehalococcoidales bacterium]MDP6737540.1 glycosyltransferase [Dehalococcoidales bacterium]|tara:strand:+ start:1774 stop:3018 length:1245 start_codon:yes stop_codon:yes gene_type:complete
MRIRHLKIAILSIHSCPVGKLGGKNTGGMSVYVREVANRLGKLGHTVDIFTRVKNQKDRVIISLGPNSRLIHLPTGGDGEIDKLTLYSYLPEFANNVENFRRNNDLHYDLIFSHYWLSGRAGQILQQWWDVPHIVMFHTLGAVKNTFAIGEEEPGLRMETERELAQDCSYVIAATPQEKAALIRYYGAKPEGIRVIPCGVNSEFFQPVDKLVAKQRLGLNGDKLILFVGRIEPLKGIEQLLRAIPLLPNTQEFRLFIIGGDEYSRYEMERLKEFVRILRIEKTVTFLGLLKQEQLPYFYSAADVCVSPSYYESFGLVPLESLACGTPVVATNVGAARSIIRHETTGYVVEDNSPRHLSDKIALILARPQFDTNSVQSIRASVSRFSWDKTTNMIIKVCQQTLIDYPTPISQEIR